MQNFSISKYDSDPATWRYLPGEHNVADDVSRGISAQSLTERWQQGPQFLSLPEHEWPTVPPPNPDKTEVEREIRKDYKVCTVKEDSITPIDCTKFSKWRRLVRVTVLVRGSALCNHMIVIHVIRFSRVAFFWLVSK